MKARIGLFALGLVVIGGGVGCASDAPVARIDGGTDGAVCADLGESCAAAACCSTALVCDVSTRTCVEPACVPMGGGCTDAPCCSGLTCDPSNVCVPPGDGGFMDDGGGECASLSESCAATSCCTGLVCDSATEQCLEPACVPVGMACGPGTCCSGTECHASASVCTRPFDSFRRSRAGGPCAPGADCMGFIELMADGTLRVDRIGEVPVMVREATVTPAELASAMAVLTDPALVAILDASEPPCEPPTDIYESMTLVESGTTHENSTTECTDAPLVAARDALNALVTTYGL